MSARKTTTASVPKPAFSPMPIDDAVMYYGIAQAKFGELAALFHMLMNQSSEFDEAHKLARLGYDVAKDYENQVACWREQLENGGVKS